MGGSTTLCGALSPDGGLMTWRTRTVFENYTKPLTVFLLDLASGVSKRLPIESRGGAGDSFWFDRWSPSGAFQILLWFGDEEAHRRRAGGSSSRVGSGRWRSI